MNDTNRACSETLREDVEMIRELIACYTDHPEAIRIQTVPIPGGNYINVRVHADDQGKAIGRKTAHLRALRVIAAELGRTSGTMYQVTLEEPGVQPRKIESPQRHNPAYDPERARGVLAKLAGFIAEGEVKVDVRPNIIDGGFTFTVEFRDEKDRRRFRDPYPELPSITLVGMIELLWSAYAKKEGTHFRVAIR